MGFYDYADDYDRDGVLMDPECNGSYGGRRSEDYMACGCWMGGDCPHTAEQQENGL